MRQLALVLSVVLVSSASAEVIVWRASDGLLPDDPAIDASQRFVTDGQHSFLSLGPAFLNVVDDSDPLRVGISKTDIPPIPDEASWAFQSVIRVNWHSRPNFDFGPTLGIYSETAQFRLVLATDAAGFGSDDGLGFVDGASALVDASEGFHRYRVTSDGAVVSLFIDNMATPALSLPTASFASVAGSGPKVWLLDTSNPGLADFDVRFFAANTAGIDVPAFCLADITGDGKTDVIDFGVFAAFFGQAVEPWKNGDLDGDGDVDVFDFGLFAGDFGCGT